MDRTDEILIPRETPWLHDPDAQRVCAAVTAEGGAVYFVGGCVRDALLKISGGDTDLSTDVLPEDAMRLARAAGLRAVPTGIDHGTVTVVSGGRGFEVTTFRRDVETDGRRAVVSFSREISQDAKRRDFTMNALYATPGGDLVDPLNGAADCLARRVRFIEDPDRRIREDYLRILRFFRFHAWYAAAGEGFDADALDAVARNADGLETLSAERIGHEMLRLLQAPDPAPAVAAMRQTGVLGRVLPGSDDRFLAPAIHLEEQTGRSADALMRLAVLGGNDVADRLRLSRSDAGALSRMVGAAWNGQPAGALGWEYGADIAIAALIQRSAVAGHPLDPAETESAVRGAEAVFPVKAGDLMPGLQGKALGEALKALEARWVASDFTLTYEDLMTPE
ncbi:CCA tRNA nucleotidyltransferase [uncultured Roseobacter sp.]|uniref:CCA tRNA nucleotidyltransferase n=1 Tax=uncultured Roseobacter sp. TaxID=114847 RepID=UPI002617C8D1|nr:CCA tRNA nucleotidyltransferase [uncultured Roseobacter sp.]